LEADDPIVKMYKEILKERIVALPLQQEDRKELLKEWRWRSKNKVAPGYKDASKDDSGIGDFLVWKTLLYLGQRYKRPLAFVTGEQKSDWFARSSGQGVYPKPELLDEYRRASEGKSLRLMSLYELLSELNVPGPIVEEVKTAEDTANTAILDANINRVTSTTYAISGESVGGTMLGKRRFDYSTNDGKISIGDGAIQFILRFSRAGSGAVHIYKDGTNLTHVGRIKPDFDGSVIDLHQVDTSSRSYLLRIGDGFLVRNVHGRLLLGKIVDVSYEGASGATKDEVVFTYAINVEMSDRILNRTL
jgi:hypothetical protein